MRPDTREQSILLPEIKPLANGEESIHEGMPADSELGLLNRIHYAKMALDDDISKSIRQGDANKARILTRTKRDLLNVVDAQNPMYARARQIWSDAASVDNAIDQGRRIFKVNASQAKEMSEDLTDAERIGFKAGAVEAIQSVMDDIDTNANAVKRVLGKQSLRGRLRQVFDSEEAFEEFVDDATREVEFQRTRAVVSSGSPTSQNLKGQEALRTAADGQAFYQTDTVGKALLMAMRIIGEQEVRPELLKALSRRLLDDGVPAEQLLNQLIQGETGRKIGMALGTRTPATTRSALLPIIGERQ
ncbi:MAG: hypothetical protein AAFY29_01575 [Pseudomonadota bacterium]